MLVSGSAEGIGSAIVMGLTEGGAEVVVNVRSGHGSRRAVERARNAVTNTDVSDLVADAGSKAGTDQLILPLQICTSS